MRFILAACLGVSLSVCHFTDALADPQLLGNPNGGTVMVSSSMINALNPYTNTATGSIEISAAATLTNEGGAVFDNESGGLLTNYGTIDNAVSGRIDNLNGATVDNDGDIINHGTFHNAGSIISTTFNNRGMLTNSDTFTNNLSFFNYSGGTLSNDGTFNSNGGNFNNSGTIAGTGSMLGTINDAGVMGPGNSILSPATATGVISIDGEWNKTAGSTKIELAGQSDGGGDKALTEFDWLEVNGNVNLISGLQVLLIDGFALTEGMSFDIVRVGGSLSGEFNGLPEGAVFGTFSSIDL